MNARTFLVAAVLVSVPALALAQTNASPDCSADPLAEITPLPFSWSATGGYADDVELGADLSTACAAGAGGTYVDGSHDFVYQLVLGTGHSVNCTFNAIGNSGFAVVLTSNCADPLAANACEFGEIVAGGGSASFDTQILGLSPGTYYFWADGTIGDAWSLNCSGTLPVSLEALEVE